MPDRMIFSESINNENYDWNERAVYPLKFPSLNSIVMKAVSWIILFNYRMSFMRSNHEKLSKTYSKEQ